MAGREGDEEHILCELQGVLTDLLKQFLPMASWQRIELLVIAADRALSRGDLTELARHAALIEASFAVRATPLGTQPSQPAPYQLRERVVILIHRADQWRGRGKGEGGRVDAPRTTE
ncbi:MULTISPECIES: CATRA system-associated protein [unclassified Micromonospora]|uniref:CATRA system-associated protein n=1 Tax=unclassified Micromonospora TaxID=2617518 RepID=UPI003642CCCB